MRPSERKQRLVKSSCLQFVFSPLQGYTVFSIPVGVVYRPNDAKVKNLKTKDYLGKARLVAASDRQNAFTGFAGSENKRVLEAPKGEDDRPPESISYAASNLVNRNLTSKRQQSEPPINRNMFPPTPPPENDKPNNPPGMTGRAASVRNPPPRPIQRTATEPVEPFRSQPPANMMQPPLRNMMYSPPQMDRPQMDRPRTGTIRTASEPRGPPQRQYSRAPNNRPQLYRETTQDDAIYDDVYDMYNTPRSSQGGMAGSRQRPRTGRNQAQQRYFNEEEEYGSDGMYEDDSVDEGDFEMMGANAPPPLRAGGRRPSMSAGGRGGSRRPDVSKIRVKVHAESDTRYIIVGPAVEFGDFEGRIREKFGIKTRLKIKMKDDGDMITMGDQDDLDMLVSVAKQMARKERSDMGKMEVCRLSTAPTVLSMLICDTGLGHVILSWPALHMLIHGVVAKSMHYSPPALRFFYETLCFVCLSLLVQHLALGVHMGRKYEGIFLAILRALSGIEGDQG